MKPLHPMLLVVGGAESRRTAIQSLQDCGAYGEADIVACAGLREALPLLESRNDVGMVLLLWDAPDTRGLPETLLSLIETAESRACPVVLRCRHALAPQQRDALWRLGPADRLFAQPIDSPDLADSLAAIARDRARVESLAAVTGAAARLEGARTLWELADQILAMLQQQGIGSPGGLFCLLGGSAHPRLMAVAGSGRFGGIGCLPVDDIGDAPLLAAIREAMLERRSRFAEDAAVLYIRTPEADVACIYLALDAPLLPWQQRLVRLLSNGFSIAIGKNQAANRLLRTQHATISTMAALAEYRDVDTGEHVARVARAVTEIAQVLANQGYVPDPEMVGQIGLAAILHDIGKIAIPEGILLKPAALSLAERQTMEMHTLLGRDILERAAARSDNAVLLRRAAEIALCHHEKFDGSGYPSGLKGHAIPLAARIVALVDVFDALTSVRPYKAAWPYEKAVETIRAGSGRHFDPAVVDAFLWLEERRKSADFFVWNDTMSVGQAEIDADHKRLIGIINRLWVAEDGGNRQVIEFVLDDLVHYTESHFKREEQMMDDIEYPDLARHRRIHQSICRRLEEIRWEYFQGIREELRGEILEFLRNWLNEHILVEDMGYRPYLGQPASAGNATPSSTIDPEPVK
ncbi:MAG TPA: bacteriohemerythrin [Rhodocyclaceae bacterium]